MTYKVHICMQWCFHERCTIGKVIPSFSCAVWKLSFAFDGETAMCKPRSAHIPCRVITSARCNLQSHLFSIRGWGTVEKITKFMTCSCRLARSYCGELVVKTQATTAVSSKFSQLVARISCKRNTTGNHRMKIYLIWYQASSLVILDSEGNI